MPTSNAALARNAREERLLDAVFVRRFVLLNATVPLALLGWDALRDHLGANGVNYAIRTTGLVGLVLLVSSLLVTPLRRLTGWNLVVASRRRLGVGAFLYLSVHLALFFLFDRAGSLSSTLHEVLTRRYLQLGTLGLTLMLPLALTSTDAMVSRLGPRRWKALHRLAYLAAILGALHYLLLVKSDLRQPLVFAAVLGGALLLRLGTWLWDRRSRAASEGEPGDAPARKRAWRGKLRVARITQETHDVKTFRLAPEEGEALPFTYEPGQYLTLNLTIEGKRVVRSYTLASSPTSEGFCELTIKRKRDGYVSGHLHDTLREGDLLEVIAPGGRFYFTGEGADRVYLLAGGVGITPLMSMVRALAHKGWKGEAHLLYAVRTQQDLVFREELEALKAKLPGLRVTPVLSEEPAEGWEGERGMLTQELLARLLPDAKRGPVYLCGPQPMMDAVQASLRALGMPEEQVFTEAFVSPAAGAAEEQPAPEPSAAPSKAKSKKKAPALVTLRFKKSGKSVDIKGDETVLEAGERLGLELPYECRAGVCGQCKTKLLEGEVTMDAEDALTPGDRARGMILACQARCVGSVEVDS